MTRFCLEAFTKINSSSGNDNDDAMLKKRFYIHEVFHAGDDDADDDSNDNFTIFLTERMISGRSMTERRKRMLPKRTRSRTCLKRDLFSSPDGSSNKTVSLYVNLSIFWQRIHK